MEDVVTPRPHSVYSGTHIEDLTTLKPHKVHMRGRIRFAGRTAQKLLLCAPSFRIAVLSMLTLFRGLGRGKGLNKGVSSHI